MQRKELGPADRAVYALIERGGIDAAHAALYRRQLSGLARAGLITRDEQGGYHAVPSKGSTPGSIPAPPVRREPPMGTLICRVPQAVLQAIDSLGPTRSDGARELLARGIASSHESGTREAVREAVTNRKS